ncbi:MAG: ATP-binding cassette domain-containing protein [Phycisphaerales bacterium]|nr:ATP-binding cassette domain-containing protein [Phycisphaerales bacterium]
MPPLVEIQHLEFSYDGQTVLRDIDLAVEQGTTLGVIGPNGGGKTTLMRLLLGLLTPTQGAIHINGLPPTQAILRGNLIGYLPQHLPQVQPFPLTVRQVVRLGLAGKTGLLRRYHRADLDFVETLLQRVGLAEMADKRIGALSGGQIQRAFIAKAVAGRPRLLILDEPTTAIDRSMRHRIIETIQQLKADLDLTIILISHDLRAVTAIADRIACLNVSLHYHDVPQHIPAELAYDMFACDLEAMGLGHVHSGRAGVTPLNISEKHD